MVLGPKCFNTLVLLVTSKSWILQRTKEVLVREQQAQRLDKLL
jgi:hypothetical protein